MYSLSPTVVKEVRKLLPEVRLKVESELKKMNTYKPGKDFYSDDMVFESLPSAAYEYIIIAWGINPSRVDKRSVLFVLDNRLFNDLEKIMAHALRRLAPIN